MSKLIVTSNVASMSHSGVLTEYKSSAEEEDSLEDLPILEKYINCYKILPNSHFPSSSFSITSHHLEIKSQQLKVIASRKSCKNSCSYIKPPDSSQGFKLIEFADKGCSQIELPEKLPDRASLPKSKISCNRQYFSKSVITDFCKCDKCVSCNIQIVSCPVIYPKPCIKNSQPPSSEHLKLTDEEENKKIIILCKKCKEDQKKEKCCHCNNCKRRSGVAFEKKINNFKNRISERSTYETRPKHNCRYMDLFQRIKCIFSKNA